MKVPKFLSPESVLAIHNQQLFLHGGAEGIRNYGLFESAINRAVNSYNYNVNDIYKLAADYAFGIIKNHTFVDGNKRVGFMACALFLAKNGIELIAAEEDAYISVIELAEGSFSENDFADWLKNNSAKI